MNYETFISNLILYEQVLTANLSEESLRSEDLNYANQTQTRVPWERIRKLAKKRLKTRNSKPTVNKIKSSKD